MSSPICSASESRYADVIDALNRVGVHPNQTRAFVPGKYYKVDAAIPWLGGLTGPDEISTSPIYSRGVQIGIRNTTLPNHVFYSGHVERTIVMHKGSYHIKTVGTGSGQWGKFNIMFDDEVWAPVDQSVADEFR